MFRHPPSIFPAFIFVLPLHILPLLALISGHRRTLPHNGVCFPTFSFLFSSFFNHVPSRRRRRLSSAALVSLSLPDLCPFIFPFPCIHISPPSCQPLLSICAWFLNLPFSLHPSPSLYTPQILAGLLRHPPPCPVAIPQAVGCGGRWLAG